MTDKVNPSLNRRAGSFETATASIAMGGGTDGYVVEGGPTDAAIDDDDLDESAMNAFEETSSSSSLTVTIDAGEGFAGGAWMARDVSTTVTLAASTTDQIVYAGWDKDAGDTVIIGLESDFADLDQKIELYSYDTDADGVIN